MSWVKFIIYYKMGACSTVNDTVDPTKQPEETPNDHDPSDQKKNCWTGHFVQRGTELPLEFNHLVITAERRVRGKGIDHIGNYDIDGARVNKNVKLIQSYRRQHKIYYQGVLDSDDSRLSGHWGFSEGVFVDTFEVKKQ